MRAVPKRREVQPHIPVLKVEKFTLPNGLTVILHEDHKTPLVGINIVYNVGSKDDMPGRTGIAHLCEHMMFKGSLHDDQEFGDLLSEFQVENNGRRPGIERSITRPSRQTHSRKASWLEADRMGYLVPALTEEKLGVVRSVVKNERRTTDDNAPFWCRGKRRCLPRFTRRGIRTAIAPSDRWRTFQPSG